MSMTDLVNEIVVGRPVQQTLIDKINEMVRKINELESILKEHCKHPVVIVTEQGSIPQRYFRNDYGYIYEVDEHGNPIVSNVPK